MIRIDSVCNIHILTARLLNKYKPLLYIRLIRLIFIFSNSLLAFEPLRH